MTDQEIANVLLLQGKKPAHPTHPGFSQEEEEEGEGRPISPLMEPPERSFSLREAVFTLITEGGLAPARAFVICTQLLPMLSKEDLLCPVTWYYKRTLLEEAALYGHSDLLHFWYTHVPGIRVPLLSARKIPLAQTAMYFGHVSVLRWMQTVFPPQWFAWNQDTILKTTRLSARMDPERRHTLAEFFHQTFGCGLDAVLPRASTFSSSSKPKTSRRHRSCYFLN